MLKKYKNELVRMIQDDGYQLADFNLDESKDERHEILVLKYANSEFKFTLRNLLTDFNSFDCCYTLFAPNFPITDIYPENEYGTIGVIKHYFKKWLNEIKEYIDELLEPDLWINLKSSQQLLNDDNLFLGEEKQFSDEEKEPIRIAIAELKLMIGNKFKLDEEQKVIVEKRLDYLSKSLDRLNKFDWKGLALSTIVGISTALAFDTTKGNELLTMFKTVFSSIVNYLH